jgi:hypothetical protein
MDRVHDERALHGGERPQPRIAALELLHDEAVRDVAHSGASVTGQVGAEEAELRHAGNQLHRERAVAADVLLDDRKELLRDELSDRIARHALLVGEELVEAQEVSAAELGQGDPPRERAAGVSLTRQESRP